jgi:autotransporter-associated beta strand protein
MTKSNQFSLIQVGSGRVTLLRNLVFWALGVSVAWLPATTQAQNIWDGGGSNNLWSTAANWNNDIVAPNPTALVLQFQGFNRLTPGVDAPWQVEGLRFDAGAGAFTLSGQQLTIASSGITNNSTSLQTISNSILLSANQTWTASTGNLSFSGLLDTDLFALSINAATSRTMVLTGNVTGNGSISKTGAGSLTLSGTNSHTGGVSLSAGTLIAGSDTAMGTGTLRLSGGTLNASAVRTFANAVTLLGSTTLSGSNMTFSSPFALGASTTLTVSNTTTTLSAGLTETGGSRSFTKAGTGSLVINSSMANTGMVTISSGTIALGSGVLLPASNLRFNGGILSTTGTFARALGTGVDQTQFIGSGGFAAYGGPLAITGFTGTPVWGTTTSFLPGTSTLIFNSSVSNNVVTWTNDFSLGTGNRTISANAGLTGSRAEITGIISGSGNLTKSGTGRLDLTAANSFGGQVSLAAGILGVSTLENAGVASSLGAGSAPIRIGSGTSSATLLYFGTGHSTDRIVQLPGSTGGATLQADGTGPVVFTGGVTSTAAGNKTLSLTGSSTANNTISGNITNGSGTLSVSKSGIGRWVLSGTNTYTGTTTLSGGTLALGNDSALGTGTFLLGSASVEASGGPRTLANTVTHQGTAILNGTQSLTFTGAWNMTGSRTLTVNTANGATLTGNVTIGENNLARTLTINGNGNLVISGVVRNGTGSGADNLSKSGNGMLSLTANNTYTGTTTLSAGTLTIGSNQALGTGTFVLSGGTLASLGGPRSISNTVTLAGNAALASSSNVTFTGQTTLTGSRTFTSNAGAIATFSNINLSNSGTSRTLTITGSGDTRILGVIANGGTSTAGAITKSGTGTLTMEGTNSYGGTTTVSGGTLEVRNSAALGTTSGGTSVASGATLAIAGGISSGENLTLTGSGVSGNGALRNLSGNNTLTGSTTITAATTITSTADTLAFARPSGDAISGSFVLTIGGAGNVLLQRRYNIGTASLLKTGTGTLTLGNAATSATSGNISIAGGAFEVNGSVAAGGTLVTDSGTRLAGSGSIARATTVSGFHSPGAMGAAGQQTFSAGLNYTATSTLDWQLMANSDSGPGTNFDQVLITGGNLAITTGSGIALAFNGAGSSVDWSNSFWNSNRQWIIANYLGAGTSTGIFSISGITMDSLGQTLATSRPDASFSISRTGNNLSVNYAAIPEPTTLVLLILGGLGLMLNSRSRRASPGSGSWACHD